MRIIPIGLPALFGLFLLIGTTTTGASDGLPEQVSLDELIGLLEKRNPELGLLGSELDLARSREARAGTFPRPELRFENWERLDGADTIDGRTQELVIETPLLLDGRRRHRLASARLGVRLAEARSREAGGTLLAEAARLHARLQAHEARLAALARIERDLERGERIIAGRIAAGLASRYEGVRIRLEAADLKNTLRREHTDQERTAAQLGALVGAPAWRPRPRGELRLRHPGERMTPLAWEEARDTIPALRTAALERRLAEAEVERVRRDARPVPVLGLGAMRTHDPRSWSGLVSLSIELPFADRPRFAIGEARAEAVVAARALAAVENDARTALLAARRVLASEQARLARFDEEVLSDLSALRSMAETAYAEGEIGIAELLDAHSTAVDRELQRIDLLESVALAEVDALAAAGRFDLLRR